MSVVSERDETSSRLGGGRRRDNRRGAMMARKVVKSCNIKLSNSDVPLVVNVTTQLTVTLKRRG